MQRVREIITKYCWELAQSSADLTISHRLSIQQIVGSLPTREHEDDARFFRVRKFFDTVINKQYQHLFCQSNQVMFANV